MSHRVVVLTVGIALCGACSADNPADPAASVAAETIKFGEEASNARPPYGLPLYPDAEVKFSTRDRSSIKIATAVGLDDLAKFYSSALEERGYALDQETVNAGSRSLHASTPGDPSSKLLVRIDQDADDAASFLLTFVRSST